MRTLRAALLAVFVAVPAAGIAQQKDDHSSHHAPAAAPATLVDGEIRKVDKEAKKLTIKHGPMADLDMPAMTMVFQVRDPAILDQVKVGDTVKFVAEKAGGAFIVTRIEKP